MKGQKQEPHEFLYWEFPSNTGQMAVRIGNLKTVRKNMMQGNLEWELYDVIIDPTESNNIASEDPAVISKVEEIVAREHTVSLYEGFRFKALGEQVLSQ